MEANSLVDTRRMTADYTGLTSESLVDKAHTAKTAAGQPEAEAVLDKDKVCSYLLVGSRNHLAVRKDNRKGWKAGGPVKVCAVVTVEEIECDDSP